MEKKVRNGAIGIVKNVVTNCRNIGYTKTVVKNDIATLPQLLKNW